ncbi:MAG: hypothetical protein JWL95_622 [Gemmatimonadetes bacterium]|nr:hypothetical protein [Gemmatimonadota bacterium]
MTVRDWRPSIRVALLASLVPFALLVAWALRAPLDLSVGDQAQYLLHARSLLEGRDYTDNGYIHYAAVPVSPAAYPPGLPLLIALVQALGGSIMVLRVSMACAATAFLYLAGRYLASLEEEWTGPATIVMCGLVPQLALYATGLYTDFVFSALVWACCLLIDRPGPWTRSRIAGLTLCGAVAITFRTAAIALIPALIVHQLWRAYRHRESRTRALVPLLVWIIAYVVVDHVYPSTAGYVHQINGAVADGPADLAYVVVARLLVRRLLAYRDLVSLLQLTPTRSNVANTAYHALALALAAVGGVLWMRRAGVRFLFCFAAFYVGILLLMPWPASRFLWPLLPGLWFATLLGARYLVESVAPNARRALTATLAAAGVIALSARAFGPPPAPLVGIGDLREGRELYDVIARMGARSALRLGFFNPRDAARLPGVSAMSIPYRAPNELLEELASHQVTHVVAGSMGTDAPGDSAMRRALTERSASFAKVFANDSFALYRIVLDPELSTRSNGADATRLFDRRR